MPERKKGRRTNLVDFDKERLDDVAADELEVGVSEPGAAEDSRR
jgi:hypothetical protein